MGNKRILLTNDDGIGAPGLRALENALSTLGDVTVVAPDSERSGSSQALTLHQPLRVKVLDDRHYAVGGTPADTVILALYQLLPQKPHLAVSGINPGGNLGENLIYSGTVAAAQEAALHGIPSFAISLVGRNPADFGGAAEVAFQLASRILREGLPPGVALNVNVPNHEIRGVRLTRQSQKISQNIVYENKDPRGKPYYWLDETLPHRQVEPDSDYAAIFAHEVSITPLEVDRTHHPSLNHLSVWLPELQRTIKP
ncbi:MAG: 5'/3'-nucleotidase SurE [Acidobacteria bacterium]|nr:MAG: 5'/3'-nucleotidase SurE [Acidobacteriota bacterium]